MRGDARQDWVDSDSDSDDTMPSLEDSESSDDEDEPTPMHPRCSGQILHVPRPKMMEEGEYPY